MGNQQPKKLGKVSKSQIQIAALKAKIHLELMRDRKSQEIIKGQKELVTKLNSKARNKTEQSLIMERVINGLKYSQAANQLISYAVSIKSQAALISENVGNQAKLQPWLTPIHSLLYAADQLGLSSLNQFKAVMKALNDPLQADKYVNPQIKQMLSPNPTPYEINIYILEMTQRNNIELQFINSVGHKFIRDPKPNEVENPSKSFSDIQNQLSQHFKKQFGANDHPSNGGNNGNQGFGGNQGGFGGQSFNNQPYPNYYNVPNPPPNQGFTTNKYYSNPYKGASHIQDGPNYYNPSDIPKHPSEKAPVQFPNYNKIGQDPRNTVKPIYPSVNPDTYKQSGYKPQIPPSNDNNDEKLNQAQQKSPTISQIMRDFDIK